jgi:GT2 family glycosyltransferase
VLLIDNGSKDGSQGELRRQHSWVRLIENDRNYGFSVGCNQGALNADAAEVFVFLNNDIRVEPEFLRELVAPIVRRDCEATTARMYSWDGKLMNSAGGGMNFHGVGIQRAYLEPPGPEYEQPRLTLFACGGAMAMRADVFAEVGGFDEEFFAYYEDVDLGWRSWVLGHSVRYVPSAICYHHHSSTSGRVPTERLRVLQVRNPMLACFKNYDDENLAKVLPTMLALATRRALLVSGITDFSSYRIENLTDLRRGGALARLWDRIRGRSKGTEPIQRVALADLVAINDWIGRWDHWVKLRATVQSKRRRPDSEILKLFLRPMWCIEQDASYMELHDGAARFFGLDELFDGLTTMDKDPHR